MQDFDVSSRDTIIRGPHFLEASAGTGKTYTIENVVLRLLIEDEAALQVEQIAVVTFTRAATSELRQRIRERIEEAKTALENALQGHETKDLVDYLSVFLEKGSEKLQIAKRRLEQALFVFDQAQIFTIHGFCLNMLREHAIEIEFGLKIRSPEDCSQQNQYLHIIKNYLRTELKESLCSVSQLERLLVFYKRDVERLCRAILPFALQRSPIQCYDSYELLFSRFQKKQEEIREQHSLDRDKLIEDFLLLSESYNGIRDRSGKVKEEILEQVEKTSGFLTEQVFQKNAFDYFIQVGFVFRDLLTEDKKKKRAKELKKENLHYPMLWERFIALAAIVDEGRDVSKVLANLAHGSQQLLQNYVLQEDFYTPEDLLYWMDYALQNPKFRALVQARFEAAIIDEFQDTDPLQWRIFEQLFLEKNKTLYLVGDPKQAIYAFRQADVYTYLKAARSIGTENAYSLRTNYRSQDRLVEALNTFLNWNHSALFDLPRENLTLELQEAKPSGKTAPHDFSDKKGSIHCVLAQDKSRKGGQVWPSAKTEEDCFFPFIASELLKLTESSEINFSDCAILVRDRYQAERLQDYLQRIQIPTVSRKTNTLLDSEIFVPFKDLLFAILHPRDQAAFHRLLGSLFLSYHSHDLQDLIENDDYALALYCLFSLRKALYEGGFMHFLDEFLKSIWPGKEETVGEQLLRRKRGRQFYLDLLHLSEILAEFQNQTACMPDALLRYVERMETQAQDEKFRLRQEGDLDAVQIMTTHMSKGLQFDVVFTLGLCSRSRQKESLIPCYGKEGAPKYEAHLDSSAEWGEWAKELDAEKLRQLYVGFTRARQRLYVMIVEDQNQSLDLNLGEASPIELFLEKISSHSDTKKLLSEIQKTADFTWELVKDYTHPPAYSNKKSKMRWKEPREAIISGENLFVESFSSLSRSVTHSPLVAPHSWNSIYKNRFTLPAGAETGQILHGLWEFLIPQLHKIECDETAIYSICKRYFQGKANEEWWEIFAELCFHSLHTPIENGAEVFCLSDIDWRFSYKEMEFLYLNEENQYLKGFIDLVFMYRDQYFIVDWKSNYLGPDTSFYSQESIHQVVLDHEYTLQAQIYTEALRRYLFAIDSRDFNEIFGGVHFIFMRGCHQGKVKQGIYSSFPNRISRA